jgi:hypothetical protein
LQARLAKALRPFVAMLAVTAFVTAPADCPGRPTASTIIARKPKRSWQNIESIQCCICEHAFEAEDMAAVPGLCRPDLLAVLLARRTLPRSVQAAWADRARRCPDALGKVLPQPRYAAWTRRPRSDITSRVMSAGLVALVIGLIYVCQTTAAHANELLADALWKVFFMR